MYFSDLARYFKKLEDTPSRNAMTEILADLFRHVTGDEIRKICYLLQGRVVPLYEALEFGVADKFMIRAVAKAYEVNEKRVEHELKRTGDLGVVAFVCYHVLKHSNRRMLSVQDAYDALYDLAHASGEGSQEKKIELLADLLRSVEALSARYLARIPLDKLRLGFSDMTMLDALSWMEKGDKSLRGALEDAYNVRPDIGYIAQTLKTHGENGLSHIHAKVGVPILAALCQRLPSADDMIKKMGKAAVEPKFDGVRVQIHYQQSTVKTFSRNLENTTAMFPELSDIGRSIAGREVILDSEAVGIDPATNRLIPFQETMTRKRKYNIEGARRSVPLRFFVFDILYKDGRDLLHTPLSDRRRILEATLTKRTVCAISPQIVTSDPGTLREYHEEQLRRGLEGVVVKKWESFYEPGRRGYSWVKFKEEEGKTGKLNDTIDAVIMGYYAGEGKRAGFGIGMFLAGIRKGEHFVTVTKIGTGVSDELWKLLRKQLEDIKVKGQPKEYAQVAKQLVPDVWVAPKIVVEIAGDDLTRSPSHGAGFAVRFPRLVRIRTDKSPSEATTVREIHAMYTQQRGGVTP